MAGTSTAWWRVRVLAIVLPVAAVLLGVSYVVPSRSTSDAAPLVEGASETRCLPTGPIASVTDLNRFVDTVRGGPDFAGGDVGASVRLQDGRDLYVFGDTLRARPGGQAGFVRNSMLVIAPGCAQVVLPAGHGALVPDRPDGVGYWPMSVARVERPGYDLVGIGLQRVHTTGSGVFDFEALGPATAILLVPRGGVPQLLGVRDLGPDSPDTTRPMWGAAALVEGEWVYLYGTARPQRATAGGFSLRVARTRVDDLLDPGRWRYWDGSRWRRDPASARQLLPAGDSVSQTLSVFERNGRWYAVSKRGEFLGSDLTVWTASSPTGPFGDATVVAHIPSEATSGTLRYMPLAHPDLLPEPGTVVVSYSENNTDPARILDDPRRYRPRFLRVPLPD
ncbi:DUF4185 domain-containing protein [Nocardioides sp. CER19]|uniref:DUF4185 domain-containing protein n=1 Tax=Nocardioides sp. CER19 TaxID=3038538 RepID=UPI00244950A4|nr:DUF4185 domain-containing protein [Nocardioides sp. CER19]MDH2413985.1 DUF4185 domain-containing protein [Nocardioides sp. CER19]